MKILLIGAFGKMGREVIAACEESGDSIACGIDKESVQIGEIPIYNDLKFLEEKVDIIIDFSTCENREAFINYAQEHLLPYCCFSTFVREQDRKRFEEASQIIPVLLCTNTSKGMNALLDMLKVCKERLVGADVVVSEYHHKEKVDAPSGSAKTIINSLKPVFANLQVSAFRVGNEKGHHKVEFYFKDEIVEISHKVMSRSVFAVGAIDMAKRLLEKQKGLYLRV